MAKFANCSICGNRITRNDDEPPWFECWDCIKKYPPSLLKACSDPFNYALRLVTGEVIRFSSATIHGEYVTLDGDGYGGENIGATSHGSQKLPYPCPRGVDVRVADIVWCAEAPEGS